MKFSKSLIAFPLVLALGCSTTTGGNQAVDLNAIEGASTGDLVVSINGTEIHEGFLDVIARINPTLGQQIKNPLTRKKFISSIVDQQLLYQEALKKNLDDTEPVIARTIIQRYNTIAGALVDQELNDAMKKAYEEKKDEQFTKVSFSQIVIKYQPDEEEKKDDKKKGHDHKKDEDKKEDKREVTAEQKSKALAKAQDIKRKLDKGEEFDAVAKQSSDDKLTRAKGGKAGQASKDDKRFQRAGLKKVVEAIFSLKKDQISDIIETDKALYIVKVTSDPIVTPFDVAQKELSMVMQSNIRSKLLEDLKKNATIKWGTKYDTKDTPTPDKGGEEIDMTPQTPPAKTETAENTGTATN